MLFVFLKNIAKANKKEIKDRYVDAWKQAFTQGATIKKLFDFVPDKSVDFLFVYGEDMPPSFRFFSTEWKERVYYANPSKNRFVGIPGDHWFVVKSPNRFFKELDRFLQQQ